MGYLFINKNLFTKIYKNLFFLFLKIFITDRTFFIFQNQNDLDFSKKRILKKNKPLIIEGSGVCTKTFKQSRDKKKIYDLIFHSRIIGDKGVYEIIEALRILEKKKFF